MTDPEREVIEQAQRIASFSSPEDAAYFAEPGSAEAKLYRQRQLIKRAAEILDLPLGVALENSIEVEGKHVYVWSPEREGTVFIDGDTGGHLYAPSSVEFLEHLASFQRGVRS